MLLRSLVLSLVVAYIVIAIFKPLIQKIAFAKMGIDSEELRDTVQSRAVTENALENAANKNKNDSNKGGMSDQTEGW